MLNPWRDPPLPANGDKAWFGWPTDDQIEGLRKEWLQASDSVTRQEIAAKIQERAFETVPYIPTGSTCRKPPPQEPERHNHCPGACSCGTSRRVDSR
jgi:hypothetical protein